VPVVHVDPSGDAALVCGVLDSVTYHMVDRSGDPRP
jgi:hypothetical protein